MYFTRTDKIIRWLRKFVRNVVFGIVLLLLALFIMMYACRYNLPLPSVCYTVDNAIMSRSMKLREATRPLSPAAVTAEKYAFKAMDTINAKYRWTCSAIHGQWISLMRQIDPANEYGLVDYDAAVKDFVREIPEDMKPPAQKKPPKSPSEVPAGETP